MNEITCKVHLGYIHDRTGAQVVVSLIAVGFKISIFVITIVTTMIITIIAIIIIILTPAINDQPRSINRRCWMMGQPRAFQRCVAVLGDALLVGHVSGGGGDGEYCGNDDDGGDLDDGDDGDLDDGDDGDLDDDTYNESPNIPLSPR